MSRHLAPAPRSRRGLRTAVGVAFGLVGVAVTTAGVYAALNANAFNTSAQSVTSGTLKLTLANNGVGFGQSISTMAPGDVVNRFVDVTTSGTLDAQNLTLGVADSIGSKLTNDATNGLHVTVTSCSGATWVVASGTATCAGTTSVVLNNAALSTLISAPSTLVSGAITAGTAYHLKMSVTLPDQTETTQNGTLPANTIQGLSASLTWTFEVAQRAATTTTS
jgi:hypothetical protein